MAVLSIEKTRDYTVMSNHHLRGQVAFAESEGPSLPHALPAGGT